MTTIAVTRHRPSRLAGLGDFKYPDGGHQEGRHRKARTISTTSDSENLEPVQEREPGGGHRAILEKGLSRLTGGDHGVRIAKSESMHCAVRVSTHDLITRRGLRVCRCVVVHARR